MAPPAAIAGFPTSGFIKKALQTNFLQIDPCERTTPPPVLAFDRKA